MFRTIGVGAFQGSAKTRVMLFTAKYAKERGTNNLVI